MNMSLHYIISAHRNKLSCGYLLARGAQHRSAYTRVHTFRRGAVRYDRLLDKCISYSCQPKQRAMHWTLTRC